MHRIYRWLFVSVLVVTGLMILSLVGAPTSTQNNPVFRLRPPSFVQIAQAEPNSPLTGIVDEAGISAYYHAPSSITLNSVRSLFRTIESETVDYIIGSVPLTNYPETEDVHVYINTSGWILAYYLSADPVGKIFDWRKYHDAGRTAISTKLENTVAVVAGQAGVSYTGATHYHFQYPNATHMALIVEWTNGSTADSFQAKLPGTYGYFERSWSLGCDWWDAVYSLDGASVNSCGNYSGWKTHEGTFTAAQLLPDQFHTIGVAPNSTYAYAGLALIYRVP